jgi:hypothetical protein
MTIGLLADVTLTCELDLNKTVGGLGKLDTTVGHRPGRFQWGHGRFQEQSKHRTNIARGARARVLSSDATAVPDHADDFCAQLDALTGLFFIFFLCSDIVVHMMMTLCISPFFSLFKLAVIAQGIAARYAQRQASSEQAHLYAAAFPLMGKLARRVLEEEGYLPKARPKL